MPRVFPSQVVAAIDRLFPTRADGGVRGFGPQQKAALMGIVSLIQQIPSELLTMSPEAYCDFVVSIATIETTVQDWTNRGVGQMPAVHGRDVVTNMRAALAECPDEFPSPLTADLAFVTDPDLRDSIRRDISAANQALHGGEWKAATVLAGSAIEALLLWGVQQPAHTKTLKATVASLVGSGAISNKTSSDPEEWGLHQYIEVATKLGLIKDRSRTEAIQAKNFRNLIHPGKAARLGQVCNRAEALSAVAALEFVVRDLTP